jgi:hypothetical protein
MGEWPLHRRPYTCRTLSRRQTDKTQEQVSMHVDMLVALPRNTNPR